MPELFAHGIDWAKPPSHSGITRSFPNTWVMMKRNLRTMMRTPEVFVFRFIQPLIFLLMLFYVAGGAIKIPGAGADGYREFVIPGIFAQSVTLATASAAVGIADDMSKGMVNRFRTLPMPSPTFLAGRALADLVQTSVSLLALAGVALAIGWRVNSGALSVVGAFLLLILASFSMSWIGALIGLSVRTVEAASSAGLIWVFPLIFLSGAYIPVQTMPGWLQSVVYWNPFTTIVQACRELFNSPGLTRSGPWPVQHPVSAALLWSLVILGIFAPLAVRRYQKIDR
jgi:ABC-2 type transport system permease protein